MTKDVGILILGLLTATMPFLGFPRSFESFLLIVIGLAIAVLAFIIRNEGLSSNRGQLDKKTDMFVENGGIKQKPKTSGNIVKNENIDDDSQNNTKPQ